MLKVIGVVVLVLVLVAGCGAVREGSPARDRADACVPPAVVAIATCYAARDARCVLDESLRLLTCLALGPAAMPAPGPGPGPAVGSVGSACDGLEAPPLAR